ncbi:hypothetical protein IV102_21960 [bacterium]|nr:hypothetical protein [bacterium]
MRIKRIRGFVLAAVFFVMVVVILLIASLFRLVPQEVRWSADHRRETLAYYTASGGIKHALAWLRKVRGGTVGESDPFLRSVAGDPYALAAENNPGRLPLRLMPPADNGNPADTYFPSGIPVLRSKPGRIRLPGDWTAEVHIFPDKNTNPHPFLAGSAGTLPPCYTMVSLAFRDVNGNGLCDLGSGENYALRVEASMVERTFARYAYFVDVWSDAVPADTPAFRIQPNTLLFAGPVHSNDTPVIEIANAAGFWGLLPGFVAPFGDELSFSGDTGVPKAPDSYDGIAYLNGNFRADVEGNRPYLGSSPGPYRPDNARYEKIFKKGQSAIRRTQRLPVPNQWARFAQAAWGATTGREVDPDTAGADQVFVNTRDLGIASTGALRELRLDVLDNAGNSLVFNGAQEVTGTATAGHPAVNLVQSNQVTYIAGTRTIYNDLVTTETGPYTITQTNVSDTPLPGYSPSNYQVSVGETTITVNQNVQTGSTTIVDPPGGSGPATGGTITVPTYSTVEVDITRPIFETRTNYIQTEVITGDGPHDVTTQVSVGEEPILKSYNPNDTVVSAVDRDMTFASNYFLSGLVDPDDPGDPHLSGSFPVFVGATTGVQITVPKGKTLVVHQDRITGQTLSTRILDGKPNGVIGVFGNVNALKGVNRGAKTILAARGDTARLKPTSLANVTINDHILQYGLPKGDLPTSGDHELGVISGNITIPADVSMLGRFNDNARALHVYASLFAAQGGFSAINIPTTSAMGQLRIIGGVLQQQIGTLIKGSRGWSSSYQYDRFLSLNPPPIFPPDGRYDVTFFRVTAP